MADSRKVVVEPGRRVKASRRKRRKNVREGVVIVLCEYRLKVGLEVAAGAGPAAVVVEAPESAVGQDAPANVAVGLDVGGRKVAEDLAVGCAGLDSVVAVPGVQGKAEPFALFHYRGGPVQLLPAGPAGGAGLGLGIG